MTRVLGQVTPHAVQVMCLHGWFGSATEWGFWPDVAEQDGVVFHFLNHRGYADRRDVAGSYSMAEFAADALEYADQQGMEQFVVLGHSMGGKAAAALAALAPSRVIGVIGVTPVSPAAVPLSPGEHAFFAGAAADDQTRRDIVGATAARSRPGWWVDRIVENSLATSTLDAFAGAVASWTGDDVLQDLRERGLPLDIPALLIVGREDPSLTPEVMAATWVNDFVGAEVVVIEGAGHYPMFETPLALASHIEAFLARFVSASHAS